MLLNQNKIQYTDYFTFLDLDWFLTDPFPFPHSKLPDLYLVYWSKTSIKFLFVKILYLLNMTEPIQGIGHPNSVAKNLE